MSTYAPAIPDTLHCQHGNLRVRCESCKPKPKAVTERCDPDAYQRWADQRKARCLADEWPPYYDADDPKQAWNAYNNYGQREALEDALPYLRGVSTTAMVAFACCLKLDGLGKPGDWL
jgi:hypothetical protein